MVQRIFCASVLMIVVRCTITDAAFRYNLQLSLVRVRGSLSKVGSVCCGKIPCIQVQL